jgi:hypothetical protein
LLYKKCIFSFLKTDIVHVTGTEGQPNYRKRYKEKFMTFPIQINPAENAGAEIEANAGTETEPGAGCRSGRSII